MLDGVFTQQAQGTDSVPAAGKPNRFHPEPPWTDDDVRYLTDGFPKLTERMASGEYMNGDEDVERERTNRRVIALLSQVDRQVILAEAEAVAGGA